MGGGDGRMGCVGGGGEGRGVASLLYSFLLFLHFVQGKSYPELRAQRNDEVEDLLLFARRYGVALRLFPLSFVFLCSPQNLRGEGRKVRNESIKSLRCTLISGYEPPLTKAVKSKKKVRDVRLWY